MGNAHSVVIDPDEVKPRVVGVFGLRYDQNHEEYSDNEYVEKQLEEMVQATSPQPIKFVTGGSRGVELIAEHWCLRNGVQHERIKPIKNILDPFGHRNDAIIRMSDDIIVFWDGICPDCSRAIRSAVSYQRHVFLLPIS